MGKDNSIFGLLVRKLQERRGVPRLWLDSVKVAMAGLTPGRRFEVVAEQGQGIRLVASEAGRFTVSRKDRGEGRAPLPVIDLNNPEALAPLVGLQVVRVIVRANAVFVLPTASERSQLERVGRLYAKLREGAPLAVGSLAHGGGVLTHAAHTGLAKAGVAARTTVMCEIDPQYVEQSLAVNDAVGEEAVVLCAPLQEVAQDEWVMGHLPKVEVLELGIPCSGASRAGRAKRGLRHPEAHPEVGHLVHAALVLVQKLQPAAVVLENVVTYSTSASADILRLQLRDMGYNVREHVLSGRDFGCLEDRVRWALVATTHGVPPLDHVPLPDRVEKPVLAHLLDDVPDDDECWRSFDYLLAKQERDEAVGNNFAMQRVEATATAVPTLRKGYHKGGSTDPLLQHPRRPELLRKFTPAEHARIKGVPARLIDGLPATTAHQILGQGIAYAPFEALFAELGRCFASLRDAADPSGAASGLRRDAMAGSVVGGASCLSVRLAGSIG